ncbi:MAG: 3'(2'), 5'-bisphosphate nucleotidase [Flavobacteriales bacterium]|jgi:3'(2'), 5'-bisphosphate nucleotidase
MRSAEIDGLFNAALEGIAQAKKIILAYYHGTFEVAYKSDNSPVTLADISADKIIREALKNTNIPIISEEFEVPSYQVRKEFSRYWLVDPLDGTKEFIAKSDDFTINIALIEDEKVVAGFICVPVTNELYFGGKQYGSLKYQGIPANFEILMKEGLKLPSEKNEIPVLVASRSGMSQQLEDLAKHHLNVDEVNVKRMGSSLKLCWLAEGKADIYPRVGPCMEWDIAAGQAIVEGAGKQVLDYNTKQALAYNKESLLSNWFIAK